MSKANVALNGNQRFLLRKIGYRKMPIIIKEYEFTETDETIYLSIPLKRVSSVKADVYCTDLFVKINYAPYIFELDLHSFVEPIKNSVAQIGNGRVFVILNKIWGQANCTTCKTPAELRNRRKESEERYVIYLEELRKLKVQKKNEHDRALVQEQMNVERAHKQKIQDIKDQEKKAEEAILNNWIEDKTSMVSLPPAAESSRSIKSTDVFVNSDDEIDEDDDISLEEEEMERIKEKVRHEMEKKRISRGERIIPPVRETREISVTFTSRGLLPTAVARESEDAKWHARIKEAKDAASKSQDRALLDDLKPEEQNVAFLLDKGKKFFQTENYQAAINAYSTALSVEPSNMQCLLNRSACYLKTGDYTACIKDANQGLLLHSIVEETILKGLEAGEGASNNDTGRLSYKVKLLVRRGTAVIWASCADEDRDVQLNALNEGLKDYKEAFELDKSDELLGNDIIGLEMKIEMLKASETFS